MQVSNVWVKHWGEFLTNLGCSGIPILVGLCTVEGFWISPNL